MIKSIDVLIPTWYRYTIDDDVDLTKLIDELKKEYPLSNIMDIIENNSFDVERLITDENYNPIEIDFYDEYGDLTYEWEL